MPINSPNVWRIKSKFQTAWFENLATSNHFLTAHLRNRVVISGYWICLWQGSDFLFQSFLRLEFPSRHTLKTCISTHPVLSTDFHFQTLKFGHADRTPGFFLRRSLDWRTESNSVLRVKLLEPSGTSSSCYSVSFVFLLCLLFYYKYLSPPWRLTKTRRPLIYTRKSKKTFIVRLQTAMFWDVLLETLRFPECLAWIVDEAVHLLQCNVGCFSIRQSCEIKCPVNRLMISRSTLRLDVGDILKR